MQGAQFPSLVRELRSHIWGGTAGKKKEQFDLDFGPLLSSKEFLLIFAKM